MVLVGTPSGQSETQEGLGLTVVRANGSDQGSTDAASQVVDGRPLVGTLRLKRLDVERTKQLVEAMRNVVESTPRTRADFGKLLAELHRLERMLFSTQLELNELLKERRRLDAVSASMKWRWPSGSRDR